MKQLSLLWHKMGSIHLTVLLCLLLVADLAWGYLCLKHHTPVFAPLNDIGLAAWIQTYGRYNLVHTGWFFILLGLLSLFCINTFACTTDRVMALWRMRARLGAQRLFFKLAPHVMHAAVIVTLGGYLCSYLFAQVLDTRTLVPGTGMSLPDTAARVDFDAFEPMYYQGNRLAAFHNRILLPRARLTLTNAGRRKTVIIGYNQPVRFMGYGLFLKNFTPKKIGGMALRVRIDLMVRKDPGVQLYLAGILLFTIGLAIYLLDWILNKQLRRKRNESAYQVDSVPGSTSSTLSFQRLQKN